LIFKIIFDNTKGNDEAKRFETAEKSLEKIKVSFLNYQNDLINYKNNKNNKKEELKKLKDNLDEIMENNKKIFTKIKDELRKYKTSKSEEIIDDMLNFFGISFKFINIFFVEFFDIL
jgi:hypothetical protein